MSATLLAEELNRLELEINRLEQRIADGRSGIVECILLEATRRTRASTQQAMAELQARRNTIPGPAPRASSGAPTREDWDLSSRSGVRRPGDFWRGHARSAAGR